MSSKAQVIIWTQKKIYNLLKKFLPKILSLRLRIDQIVRLAPIQGQTSTLL